MSARAYRNYLLAVLLVVLAFNGMDGLALGLVLQSIKIDLRLSDTQLGLLSGIAFALFYSVMGIPIARWADRGNRVTIVGLTAAAWSVMVALCGVAASFAQLLLIRIGVAVGEAGCMPPAQSLIADYFPREERPRAVGIYMLGGSLSVVIGYFIAGWLNQLYGWRTTFMLLGASGVVPAGLAWLTLKEPRRDRAAAAFTFNADTRSACDGPAAPVDSACCVEVCRTLWANITFRHLLLSFSITGFFGNGLAQWLPAFFIRSFGLKTGELGTWFAVINGAGGAVGTYLGGRLASRYAPRNERLQLKGMAVIYCAFGIITALIYLSSNKVMALVFMGLSTIGVTLAYGPLFATIQTLVPERMRAVAIATIYLFANLIGLGLGPLAVGTLSDVLQPYFREESLRYALLAMSPGFFWSGWHLWQGSRTVSRDLEALEEIERRRRDVGNDMALRDRIG